MAWSRQPSPEALSLVDAAIREHFPASTTKADFVALKERYGPGLAEELERQIHQRRLQSPHKTPLPAGLSVLLQADPNLDFRPGTNQREVEVPGRWFPVGTLQEAQVMVKDFIWAWDLGGGNWTGGKLARDGTVFARIGYHAQIFDMTGKELFGIGQELRPLSPDEIGHAIMKAFLPGREAPIGTPIEPTERPKAQRGQTKKQPRTAAVPRKPVPFSSRRHNVNPAVKAGIEREIDGLESAERPDAVVSSWSALTPADVGKVLKKAGKKKIGAVVELIRRLRRERPDLDPALNAAIQKEGTLNERGNAIEIPPGVTVGLALVKDEVARILWAARYLNAVGEL